MTNKTISIRADFSVSVYAAMEEVANRHGTTKAEALASLIRHGKYMDDVFHTNGRIFVEHGRNRVEVLPN